MNFSGFTKTLLMSVSIFSMMGYSCQAMEETASAAAEKRISTKRKFTDDRVAIPYGYPTALLAVGDESPKPVSATAARKKLGFLKVENLADMTQVLEASDYGASVYVFVKCNILSPVSGSDSDDQVKFVQRALEHLQKNPQKAADIFRQGIDAGHNLSKFYFATMHIVDAGITRNPKIARTYFQELHEAGMPEASVNFAAMLEIGEGGPRNEAAAADVYEIILGRHKTPIIVALAAHQLAGMRLDGRGGHRDVDGAIAYYERAIEEGHGLSANTLAGVFERGDGTKRNIERARILYQRAMDDGYDPGILGLANLLFNTNESAARALYAQAYRACSGHPPHPAVLCVLGDLYAQGKGVDKDLRKAVETFEQAAGMGSLEALHRLSDVYEYGGDGVERNPVKAVALLRQALDRGSPEAQLSMANRHLSGNGVERNPVRAFELFTAASRAAPIPHGVAALNALGWLHERGSLVGVEQDPVKAVALYQQAADRGDGIALFNMGRVHEIGIGGVPVDYRIAFDFYTEAAARGLADAHVTLGHFHENALGRDVDNDAAFTHYRMAAELGSAQGAHNWAVMIANRKGPAMENHMEKAVELFRISAEEGYLLSAVNFAIFEHRVMPRKTDQYLRELIEKAVQLFTESRDTPLKDPTDNSYESAMMQVRASAAIGEPVSQALLHRLERVE